MGFEWLLILKLNEISFIIWVDEKYFTSQTERVTEVSSSKETILGFVS